MLQQIRHSLWTRVFWGFTALYLLNISVDAADPYPEHIAEDLSINELESLVEVLLEQVLGFEDIIKEYDDPDHQEHNQKKLGKWQLSPPFEAAPICWTAPDCSSGKPDLAYLLRYSSGFASIHAPPPKV